LSEQSNELRNMVFAFRLSGAKSSDRLPRKVGHGLFKPQQVRGAKPGTPSSLTDSGRRSSRSTAAHAAEIIPFGESESMELNQF
jgi:hypothetical protein